MFAPLIPLFTVIFFVFALVLMLIGLVLSSKKAALDTHELELPLARRARQRQVYRASAGRGRRTAAYVAELPAGAFTGTGSKQLLLWGLGKIPNWLPILFLIILAFGGTLALLLSAASGGSGTIPMGWMPIVASEPTAAPAQAQPTLAPQVPAGTSQASEKLQRLGQMDRAQYNSDSEHNLWGPSACSAASMTAVINAYGNNYRITDVLKVAIEQNAIHPDLGLLEPSGINRTVEKLGFRTVQMNKAPLDSLIAVANNGWPIIIGFPPGARWPGGHILVLTGGEGDKVFLADSAPSDLPWVTRDRFMQDWGGMALIVMPKDR